MIGSITSEYASSCGMLRNASQAINMHADKISAKRPMERVTVNPIMDWRSDRLVERVAVVVICIHTCIKSIFKGKSALIFPF